MLSDNEIIQILKQTGHIEFPFGEKRVEPLPDRPWTMEDSFVREGIESYQDFMSLALEPYIAKYYPRRFSAAVKIDGTLGPAMEEMMSQPRCGHPDYSEETLFGAVGSGNWKRCHGIGEYHAASVSINNAPGSHLAPVFEQVLLQNRDAYRQLGLYFYYTGAYSPIKDGKTPINIDFNFVNSSSGWIGLAQVVNNASCTSRIWCRYLRTYRGGSNLAGIARLWTILVMHELGHNCGLGHSRGGVMNPSILSLNPTWIGDPSYNLLKNRFGGHAVPTKLNYLLI